MMNNILVPTDFSFCADNALKYALVLAKKYNATLTIMTAYYVPSAGATSVIVKLEDDLRESAEKQLQELGDKLRESNPTVNLKLFSTYNSPVNAVLRAVKENDFDAVVMGTTGATGAKEVFVGSTTSSLINKIKLPIFAVPESSQVTKASKIFLAADLKDNKVQDALNFIKNLATDFDSKIEVMNVSESPNPTESFEIITEALEMESNFRGIKHHFNFIESSDIEKAIIDFVDEKDSLIAVINRERSFFNRLFHKSISKKLAMHTKVPILILHD
jgi:nucleotide-binding universal stress UspA family protein